MSDANDGQTTKYGPQGLGALEGRVIGDPRRFRLEREEDVTGVSGTGVVALGAEFADGVVAYRWTTKPRTTQIAPSIEAVEEIHGHGNSTEVVWIDDETVGKVAGGRV